MSTLRYSILLIGALILPSAHSEDRGDVYSDYISDLCDGSDNWISAHATLGMALFEIADSLGNNLQDVGSVIFQWSTTKQCLVEDDHDFFEKNCIEIVTYNHGGDKALELAKLLQQAKPSWVTGVAWALSNELGEYNLPITWSRISIPNKHTSTLDMSIEDQEGQHTCEHH